jgi:hypothetical protein
VQRHRGEAEIAELGEAGVIVGLQGLPHQWTAPHKAGVVKGKGEQVVNAE